MRCLNGSDAQSTGAARHPGLRVARDAPRVRQAMAPSFVAVCFFLTPAYAVFMLLTVVIFAVLALLLQPCDEVSFFMK